MIADVQRGIPLKVCLYFHVLSRHGKAHFGGVVRVRFQEVAQVLLNTIHRPAGKALVGFQLPARCCYSIALSSFGLIHSAVYSFDVIRNIAIIRFRLNIISGHGQGRSGFGAILQQLGKFCFVRDFTLSITYIIQLPACKCLSFGSICGSQSHFSACGHRGIQHFVPKFCCGIDCGHSVHRAHIAAGVAVSICCIGVIMVSPLFIRLTRAVCGSAHPPVFGSVMFPPVIMPMHIQYDIHFLVLSDIIIVAERLGIGVNRKDIFIFIDCAATCSSCFVCVKVSRQSGKVKLSITFNCNIIAAVLPFKRLQSRIVRCIQRRQICIRNIQILQILVRTYIQFRQICIRNIQLLQLRVRTYIQYTQWIFCAA